MRRRGSGIKVVCIFRGRGELEVRVGSQGATHPGHLVAIATVIWITTNVKVAGHFAVYEVLTYFAS